MSWSRKPPQQLSTTGEKKSYQSDHPVYTMCLHAAMWSATITSATAGGFPGVESLHHNYCRRVCRRKKRKSKSWPSWLAWSICPHAAMGSVISRSATARGPSIPQARLKKSKNSNGHGLARKSYKTWQNMQRSWRATRESSPRSQRNLHKPARRRASRSRIL